MRGRGSWGSRNENEIRKPFIYYRYNEEGHKASEWPQYDANERGRARVVLIEEEEETNIELMIDFGKTLMIRRAMIILKKLNMQADERGDSLLCTYIFHTRCTLGGKICNVIIDGGRCENFISKVMVEKLNLNCEKHLTPYCVTWIKKGNEVLIHKRYLIIFSIKNTYQDEVWCVLIPMDACYILLGRPWQFDRRDLHDGGNNTYTI